MHTRATATTAVFPEMPNHQTFEGEGTELHFDNVDDMLDDKGGGEAGSTNNPGVQEVDKAEQEDRYEAAEEVQLLTPEELGVWIKESFSVVLAGSEDDWSKAELLTDRSATNKQLYFLSMMDTGHEVQVIYGLTKVPREHQMRNASQVIAFLDERRFEVPMTMYIGYEAAIERSLFHVPTKTEVESAFGT